LVIHFTRSFLATPNFNPGYAYATALHILRPAQPPIVHPV